MVVTCRGGAGGEGGEGHAWEKGMENRVCARGGGGDSILGCQLQGGRGSRVCAQEKRGRTAHASADFQGPPPPSPFHTHPWHPIHARDMAPGGGPRRCRPGQQRRLQRPSRDGAQHTLRRPLAVALLTLLAHTAQPPGRGVGEEVAGQGRGAECHLGGGNGTNSRPPTPGRLPSQNAMVNKPPCSTLSSPLLCTRCCPPDPSSSPPALTQRPLPPLPLPPTRRKSPRLLPPPPHTPYGQSHMSSTSGRSIMP